MNEKIACYVGLLPNFELTITAYNKRQEENISEEIRLTRDIHIFVRGKLIWKKSLRLLDEIIDSDEWLNHIEMDMLIYEIAYRKREKESYKPPVPKYC